MFTIGGVLAAARQRLRSAPHSPSPREATLLLGHVLGVGEVQILTRPERTLSSAERTAFENLLERRLGGEPVSYLTGQREFFGRSFAVDDRVLIPRPETEHVIEAALALELPPAPCMVDVGTGSGCIAITLALERSDARVVAIDRSIAALAVAAGNRRRLDDGTFHRRLELVCGDTVDAVALDRVDLLVSNPPYVDPAERSTLSAEVVSFEPALALFAPAGGRAMLDRLLDVGARLRAGTAIILEIGYDQAAWLRDTVDRHPGLRLERLIDDYGGIPRTAVLRAGGIRAGAT